MNNISFLIIYKLVFALIGLFAVGLEISVLSNRGIFDAGNFFGYFTIQSNLFAHVMLIVSVVALCLDKTSRVLDYLRGASTLYMIITGVIFAVLLSGYNPRLLTAVPIDNTILHYVLPIVMAIDWLIDPPQRRIRFTRALAYLAYPLAYLAYTLIRGSIVGWYPYPFLDPTTGMGYGDVILTAIFITLFALGVTWLLSHVGTVRSTALHHKA